MLADEVCSRAFGNLRSAYQADGIAARALIGIEGDRELRRWSWDSPYVEPLARAIWDELSPALLGRRLRSFLVREPDALGFVGQLPVLPARPHRALDLVTLVVVLGLFVVTDRRADRSA